MTERQLEVLYRRFLLELWTADLDVVDGLAAELAGSDFVIHQARMDGRPSEGVRGPAALSGLVRQGREPFTEVTTRIDAGPLVDGDGVAARWTLTGRYRGGVEGATAPAGTTVSLSGLDLMRARDGRFVEYWVSSDVMPMMRQLGMG